MNKQRLMLFIPLAIFLMLTLLFWKGLSLKPNELPSALLNKPVPDFVLPVLPAKENPDGKTEATAMDFQGQVSLLNVWATWCVICRVEHAYLNQLKAQGVLIYGINYKDDPALAVNWLEQLHNPYVYSIVDQEGNLGLDLGVYGAPETFVIDKKGIIRYRHAGDLNEFVWSQTIKPLVDSLQKE